VERVNAEVDRLPSWLRGGVVKYFVPDYQDVRLNDDQLYYLFNTAIRLGCEPTMDPEEASFWLVQLADIPAEGAHSGFAKDIWRELISGRSPSGTTPAFIFTPAPSGYLWWYYNLYEPDDAVGLEAEDDEDLSEAFHEFVGVLWMSRNGPGA
jgi:hypothetical protein